MGKIGLAHPVFAPIDTEPAGTIPTYSAGVVVGKAIEATEAIDFNDASLYADNVLAEYDNSFKKGKLTVNVDDLTKAVKKLWFGSREVSEGGFTVTKDAGQYSPQYGGFGYYSIRKKSGTATIEAHWYYKTIWNRPNNEGKTKGESIEWQTPKVEGVILAANDSVGGWHKEIEFSTESEAIAWLDTLAGIVTPSALALSSSTPADGASSMSKTADHVFTFNNAISKANTKIALVNTTSGNEVTYTDKGLDAAGKVWTLTPTALTGSVKHIIVLDACDIYGQHLRSVLDFTTVA